jgi:SAM-dependent methyltransferase
MRDFWEQRYSEEEFVYGTEPNAFLVSQKNLFKPHLKTLVVGDGEGRNGVWLAGQGLDVLSVDYAEAGLKKAQAMAGAAGVELRIQHADLTKWDWPQNEFDLVISIYLHFSSDIRPLLHKKMLQALKPGGLLIMEAFNKNQLKYNSGGPPVENMLFSAELLRQDFSAAQIDMLEETTTELKEGKYHSGEAAIVRLVLHKSV